MGRPENKDMLAIFTKLCEWLESEAELYTFSELHQKVKDLSGGKEVYTVKRLKQKLQEHYKEFIFFPKVQGRANVVCFRNMVDFLTNETWHAQRKKVLLKNHFASSQLHKKLFKLKFVIPSTIWSIIQQMRI